MRQGTRFSRIAGGVAASIPGALRVFDELRIDCCCAGRRSLGEACTLRGLDMEDVLARIEEASIAAPGLDEAWRDRILRAPPHHPDRAMSAERDALDGGRWHRVGKPPHPLW